MRAFAAVGLGLIGSADAVPDLMRYLNRDPRHPSLDVPVCAAVGIGLLGNAAGAARDDLVRVVRDPKRNPIVRAHALTALGKLGADSVFLTLCEALRDDSVHVARSALIALGDLDAAGDPIVIKLLAAQARDGRDPQTRNWALVSLGRIGGAEAGKVLRERVEGASGSSRAFAAIALAMLAAQEEDRDDATAVLRAGLASARDVSTRGAYCVALGLVKDRVSAPRLEKIVAGVGAEPLRGYAALALGLMSAREALSVVQRVHAMSAASPELHQATGTALGLLGDRSAVVDMTTVIRESRDVGSQCAAASALGLIGDRTAVPHLIEIASDVGGVTDSSRSSAIVALGLISDPAPLPSLHRIAMGTNYRALVESLSELLRVY